MTNDTYICAVCKNEYKFGWSEEEALKELKENFAGHSKEGCAIVCDDCYQEMFG